MITKFSASSISGKLFYRSMLAGNEAFSDESDFLIQEQVLTSTASTITFSSIPQTYKHLQLRVTARSDNAAEFTSLTLRCNGVSTASYSYHELYGVGSGTPTSTGNSAATAYSWGWQSGANAPAGVFSGSIMDILDYSNTTTNKTMRTLNGMYGSSFYRTYFTSGVFLSTAAISSLTIATGSGSFQIGSRFSLYGSLG